MTGWLKHLDSLLRGEKTHLDAMEQSHLELPASRSLALTVVLAGIYGATMGVFAVSSDRAGASLQLIASAVKLPALFLFTLLVTYPSLYVFSVIAGCHLRFLEVLRLLLAAVVVTTAVAASLAPILAFFTLSTTSYSFMVLLNVLLLGIAGAVGLGFLRRALELLMAVADRSSQPVRPRTQAGSSPNPVVSILRVWLIIYALVGAQMGWLLRPFIGSPRLDFTWFRVRESNFFHSLYTHIEKMIGG